MPKVSFLFFSTLRRRLKAMDLHVGNGVYGVDFKLCCNT